MKWLPSFRDLILKFGLQTYLSSSEKRKADVRTASEFSVNSMFRCRQMGILCWRLLRGGSLKFSAKEYSSSVFLKSLDRLSSHRCQDMARTEELKKGQYAAAVATAAKKQSSPLLIPPTLSAFPFSKSYFLRTQRLYVVEAFWRIGFISIL